jgi:hypothetical protein
VDLLLRLERSCDGSVEVDLSVSGNLLYKVVLAGFSILVSGLSAGFVVDLLVSAFLFNSSSSVSFCFLAFSANSSSI